MGFRIEEFLLKLYEDSALPLFLNEIFRGHSKKSIDFSKAQLVVLRDHTKD